MSQRDLTVLGCSSQVPTRHRNHNGYLIRWDGEGFLFDPGEGTQRQFIFANLPPSSVTRVFITHFHGDHCLGMAGMFQRLSLDAIPHPLKIYYPASGHEYLERMRRASIYWDRLKVEYYPIEREGVVANEEKLRIEAFGLDHPVPTLGYRFEEAPRRRMIQAELDRLGLRGPAVGRLLGQGSLDHGGTTIRLEDVSRLEPGASFAFVMDTRPCPGAARAARDVDLLVCESTFLDSESREADEYGHMTVGQAARLARDAGAKHLLLAHFSQRYQDLAPFRVAAEEIFPSVEVAEDLLQIPFPKRRP